MMWWYGNPWVSNAYGGWWWPGLAMSLFWLIVVAAIVVPLIRLGRTPAGERSGRNSAMAILEERYARGEVGRDEYLEKKRDLGAQAGR